MQSIAIRPGAAIAAPSGALAEVEEAIRSAFSHVRSSGRRAWNARIDGSAVEIRSDERWVDLDFPTRIAAGESSDRLLAANADLPDSLRYYGRGAEVRLGAAIPLDNRGALAVRIAQARDDYVAVAQGEAPAGRGEPLLSQEELQDLVRSAGMTLIERKSGVGMEIECGVAGTLGAVLEARPGGICARLDLEPLPENGDAVTRRAATSLLWSAGSAVRLVGASLESVADGVRPSLQSYLAGKPQLSDLVHLAGALAVAAGMCVREVATLADDERMARLYVDRLAAVQKPATQTRASQRRLARKEKIQ